ncbi:alpha/beta fold hydrolase [Patulibacter defluvii]|uniref:alpha/beta fold hydrolase n=1 Tax=Patulibacter defluvii TaxID=3095358 RepID=UPI002A74E9AF|nr:alpha/beta fold hydrolase [Patulibacter sp. DM4]
MTPARPSSRSALTAALAAAACLAVPAVASADGLRWRACASAETAPGLQCASLRVPLDWARPHAGPTVRLAIARLPARDRRRRIGPLFVNPGGPGGSAVEAVGLELLTPRATMGALRERFDVIGVDPRGVGGSTPLRCGSALARLGVPPVDLDDASFAAFRRANAAAGRECRRRSGPLFDHVDGATAARDVDAVRRALGARRISWLGLSYGSLLGEDYAARYPRRVRAMVLDGAVDRARPIERALVEEAAAQGRSFDAFGAWCAATSACALHGQDVAAVLDRLMAAPGGVPDSAIGRPATGAEITYGLNEGLQMPDAWPLVAEVLARADGQHGPADAAGIVRRPPAVDPLYRTATCADLDAAIGSAADARRLQRRVQAVAPHTWRYTEWWEVMTGCSGWPVRRRDRATAGRVTGVERALVVGNATDASTPLPWARSLARRIDGSRLLTYEGVGHTGLFHSRCVQRQEARFLVTRALPPRGAVCRS